MTHSSVLLLNDKTLLLVWVVLTTTHILSYIIKVMVTNNSRMRVITSVLSVSERMIKDRWCLSEIWLWPVSSSQQLSVFDGQSSRTSGSSPADFSSSLILSMVFWQGHLQREFGQPSESCGTRQTHRTLTSATLSMNLRNTALINISHVICCWPYGNDVNYTPEEKH